MAKWCVLMVLTLAIVLQYASAARLVPSAAPTKDAGAGLKDQKNFLTYGGVGGYSGVGANGLPFGGVGGGIGGGANYGGGLGGGLGGAGGLGGIGGLGGAGGLGGGAGIGGGTGTGTGVVPFP